MVSSIGTYGADPPTKRETDSAPAPQLPAEETRLDTAVFRAGLKRLGLIDVLDLHLRDFPPSSEVARLLMTRDIKRAEFADPTRPRTQRLESISEANQILERVIAEHGDDPRVLEWQFALVRSLLYEEAEESVSRALFREEPIRNHEALAALTGRALAAADELRRRIQVEYQRIDQLSAAEFEALERKGYVDELDRLEPQAEYIRLWALFYDSFWRDDADPTKAQRLTAIAEAFRENPAWLNTPHERSRIQVQASLLAGMTARRLNDRAATREHLDRAVTVADAIGEDAERGRIAWAVSLGWIERARDERDQGRLDDAMATVQRFRKELNGTNGDSFSERLVAALTERSIHKARAQMEDKLGRTSEAAAARTAAWKSVFELIRTDPAGRDAVYYAIYELIGPDTLPTAVDPLERSAMIAGCLADAERQPDRVEERQQRAIAWAEPLLATESVPDNDEGTLAAEALFNAGLAHYRLGNRLDAARLLLRVARDYPGFAQALRSVTLAVQLAASEYGSASDEGVKAVRPLYRESLEILVKRYPGTPEEGYWRFFYAQLLDEAGESESAAAQFALVDPSHPLYLDAQLLRFRVLVMALKQQAAEGAIDPFAARQRANEIVGLQRDLEALAKEELRTEADAERTATLRDTLAQVRVLTSEVLVLSGVDRPTEALAGLEGIEREVSPTASLLDAAWRVRLLALERLGRHEEMAKAATAFVQADPADAATILQELYERFSAEARTARFVNDPETARRKSEAAWVLAQQLNEWKSREESTVSPPERRLAAVQWAEANLHAGRFEDARRLFEALSSTGVSRRDPLEPRIQLGLAEAMFQLNDCAAALPLFNRLAAELPPSNAMRWHGLLRDLECRTKMNEPASDIIKVIEQQRYLYPDLGGPEWSSELNRVQRENERRATAP